MSETFDPEPIDLRHLGVEGVIGVYVLETDDGPALFDCGPSATVARLHEGLAEQDLELADIRHLLLSHIHLDHAGAAGVLVHEHPNLRVHVSGIGAPHLVDPSRLERSARRLYGAAFDSLWGELAPVPQGSVDVVGDRVVGLDCFPSPGHASHHVCYLDEAGVLYAGDAAGVQMSPGRAVMPPTPPPDVDVEAWTRTLDEIERRSPARLALTHFGVANDPLPHLHELRERLDTWSERVAAGASEREFVDAALAELSGGAEKADRRYEQAMPLEQSYAGLRRYWDRRAETSH